MFLLGAMRILYWVASKGQAQLSSEKNLKRWINQKGEKDAYQKLVKNMFCY
jgi:hypothetical protein